ncbi:MAG: YdbL family protein [Pseudohongiella sp.]|nr:YdbL family protein [Pseudohongiella sp.]
MKTLVSKTAALLFCLMLLPAAYAATLQEAKAQGLVGEQRDGYVGLVVANAPADIVALVRDVNNQRRQLYQQIAQQNGIPVEQVAALAYEKAVTATQSGHFIQHASGAWVRK